MPSRLNPYISFSGDARQAMEFYRGVLGGDLTLHTFGDMGGVGPGHDEKIMHAQLETAGGFVLMGADNPPGVEHRPGTGIAVSLSGDDPEELRGYWEGLTDGADVFIPLEKQMWGDVFGMCTDKFGVRWMVNISGR
ncbi:VOC family protein [Streptomyces griseus]|uniref:VOC family protein n=1 Tax=Streptomyces griseus TaxID=1911 RepID=UPI000840241B|nr:VOC family protein [Streptomyces griseus]